MEAMIAAKEKITKNNLNGAAFTDDGLPMGMVQKRSQGTHSLIFYFTLRHCLYFETFEPVGIFRLFTLVPIRPGEIHSGKESSG